MEIVGRIKTNNYFKDRRDPKTNSHFNPTMLVLHITDSSFKSTKAWFEDPHSYVSANWVLDKNGKWWECVDEKDGPWTNGRVVRPTRQLDLGINPNLYSITIEVVNSGEIPPWKQWISWARGCKEIMDRHGFTVKDVANHFEINAGKRCPRPWFSRFYLQLLLRFIN